jgi:ADP-glucose pyrophosphorylase
MDENNTNDTMELNVPDKPEKKVTISRTPLFQKIYATNISVMKTDSDFRIELFNEKFETEDRVIFHSDGLIILTDQAAKKLLINLSEKIEEYENKNGEIRIDGDRMNCNLIQIK